MSHCTHPECKGCQDDDCEECAIASEFANEVARKTGAALAAGLSGTPLQFAIVVYSRGHHGQMVCTGSEPRAESALVLQEAVENLLRKQADEDASAN